MNDVFIIYDIYNDEFKINAKYEMLVGNFWSTHRIYFIDKCGLYKIGDTIFISSLRKDILDNEKEN